MTSASQKILPFRKAEIRRRELEIAFLPAALEIIERPPSPVGRAIAGSIIAVFVIALMWASIGRVDIVATATGKIVPGGRTKLIQPFETGVVRAIHVRDGQTVRAGDVLIELDPTMLGADAERERGDLMAAGLEVARLRAALTDKPLDSFQPPIGAPTGQVEMQRQFLVSQKAELDSKLAEIGRQQSQKEAERATIQATVAKIQATLPVLEEKVEIHKGLLDKGLASKVVYLTEKQELVGLQQDIAVQTSRLKEADAAAALLKETRDKTASEYRRAIYDALAKAEQKAGALAQDNIKAEQRARLQRLTAPVDGVIQQLAVHTIGGVVTPAQALAVVVPSESKFEIEASIPNRDIGFVHAGQEAEVKVDTFNFTRYGLLRGEVVSVSSDAVMRETPRSNQTDRNAGGAMAGDQKGQELEYIARVSLERSDMQIDEKRVKLVPGMAVTVEVKTGARRIISYLLSPLARYSQETLRER